MSSVDPDQRDQYDRRCNDRQSDAPRAQRAVSRSGHLSRHSLSRTAKNSGLLLVNHILFWNEVRERHVPMWGRCSGAGIALMRIETKDAFWNAKDIYIIDDSADVRTSLHELFASLGINAWPFRSGGDFLDAFDSLKPAPILVDIYMPEIDGLEFMSQLRRLGSSWPVIVMTGRGEVPIAVKAMRLGAVEFLSKPFELDALIDALGIASVALEDTVAEEREREAALARFATLTQREHEVTRALATGLSNKETALVLDLSVRTVEMHRANALRKLGIGNIIELVALIAAATPGKPTSPGYDPDRLPRA
ncbi:response regulator [Sphingomonas sp. BIUV-7]|uniref:Response regulator n=2 Tax=Sphingomonas natans TaxID=3063330 RepID=A0ABT8Y573_9SPHN|nr:response regulator [Sphingomonas sp. BIUV-7]